MWSVIIRTFLMPLVLVSASAYSDYPAPRVEDRIRIAEAFQLADSVSEKLWTDWGKVPFVILLITESHEYLLLHPDPPEDFVSLGIDDVVGTEIFARPNSGSFSLGFEATFPAVAGVNTVVIGTPENTGKSSTRWVLTALHEHFHQLQYNQPWYYSKVNALDLANGDETGMWQLNYPFPYDSAPIGEQFIEYRDTLAIALDASESTGRAELDAWTTSRAMFRSAVEQKDYRYLSFQLWQEGVARYTEYVVAREAISAHRQMPDFEALKDSISYQQAFSEMMSDLREELSSINLAEQQRIVVYPVGAAEALLMDRLGLEWKAEYFNSPFRLDAISEQ
jgi:hypothetical protein